MEMNKPESGPLVGDRGAHSGRFGAGMARFGGRTAKIWPGGVFLAGSGSPVASGVIGEGDWRRRVTGYKPGRVSSSGRVGFGPRCECM